MSAHYTDGLVILSYYARPTTYTTGGVNQSRIEWASALASAGNTVILLDALWGYQADVSPPLIQQAIPHLGHTRPTYVPLTLGRLLRRADLLVLHEGWTLSNLIAAIIATLRRVPYVVIPHGVYDPRLVQDLKFRRLRSVAESALLRRAAAVHVFFASEIEHIRRIASAAEIITQMTGFPTPQTPVWNGAGGYVAFLGRYDIHHKGLDVLLSAMASLSAHERPRVEMRGPDHRGDRQRLEAMLTSMGLTNHVSLGGVLHGADTAEFLRRARLVIHPSRWEAFGRSIAEGLALGVPTAVSDTANIAPVLQANDAAIVFEPTPVGIARVLKSLPDEDSAATLGRAGHQWLLSAGSWPTAAKGFMDQLAIVLARGAKKSGPDRLSPRTGRRKPSTPRSNIED